MFKEKMVLRVIGFKQGSGYEVFIDLSTSRTIFYTHLPCVLRTFTTTRSFVCRNNACKTMEIPSRSLIFQQNPLMNRSLSPRYVWQMSVGMTVLSSSLNEVKSLIDLIKQQTLISRSSLVALIAHSCQKKPWRKHRLIFVSKETVKRLLLTSKKHSIRKKIFQRYQGSSYRNNQWYQTRTSTATHP